MLILQILTLLNWIASARPTTDSMPALTSRQCRTEQDCRNLAYCSTNHYKCEITSSWCHRDGDCDKYGPSVFCDYPTCIIDLKCSSSEDCYNVFKCKKSECIAEIENGNDHCDIDEECNQFQYCKDEQCKL